MSIRGFELNKGSLGANTNSSEDNVTALLTNGVAVAPATGASGVELETVYLITKLKDAEVMGITSDYDDDNDLRINRHIAEFFRLAPEGTKLYVYIADQAVTMKGLIEDHARTVIAFASGSINRVGVSYNPPSDYVATYVDGIEDVVRESLAPAQALHDWTWDSDRPITVWLEGRGFNATGATALNLRALTSGAAALNATHVALVIGQDWDYAEDLSAIGQKFADLGTALGVKAAISVNRNIGEVETLDISSATKNRWLTPGLSNHQTAAAMDDDLADLNIKGFIFGLTYTGIPGVRFNSDHTCAPIVVDDDGYIGVSCIGYAETLNKAARMLRRKLLPKVNTTVPVDSTTGLLPVGMIKYFEGLGDEAFINMVNAGEISDGKTIVDPNSQLLTGEKVLSVSFVVVPTASIGKIRGTINLKTKL